MQFIAESTFFKVIKQLKTDTKWVDLQQDQPT